jgi:hypothetical protein
MEGTMKWMNPIQSSDGFYEVKNIWDWKFPKWKFNGDMRGAREELEVVSCDCSSVDFAEGSTKDRRDSWH